MKVLVTGATGFIGSKLVQVLKSNSEDVVTFSRSGSDYCYDITDNFDWQPILKGVDVVVHLAGRAHLVNDSVDNPLEEFRRVNNDATVRLAKNCVASGVKRFIYFSSLGVHEGLFGEQKISPDMELCPISDYAISKAESEISLSEVVIKSSSMDLVVIRPPLVFSHNAPGNFARLLKLVDFLPIIPFGSFDNQKSFVHLDNLVDFTYRCITYPRKLNGPFICSESEDIKFHNLIKSLSYGIKNRNVNFRFPRSFLRFVFFIFGKKALLDKLVGTLTVDSSKCSEVLNWQAKGKIEESIEFSGRAYKVKNDGR